MAKKSQKNSDKFWRKQVNSPVVDLRALVNKEKETQKRSTTPKKKKSVSHSAIHSKIRRELYRLDLQEVNLQPRFASVDNTQEDENEQEQPDPKPQKNHSYSLLNVNLIPKTPIHFPEAFDDEHKKPKPASPNKQRKQGRSNVKKERQLRENILGASSSPKKRVFKKALTFAVVSLVVLGVPLLTLQAYSFKETAHTRAEEAYKHMQKGRDALLTLNAEDARENFGIARDNFQEIESGFSFLSFDLVSMAAIFPIQSKVGSMAHLVRAGEAFASAGYEASGALSVLQGVKDISVDENDSDNAEAGEYLTDNIIKAGLAIESARKNFQIANHELSQVRPEDIIEPFSEDILAVQRQTTEIEKIFGDVLSSMDVLLSFLGHSSEKNYFLAFQNYSELRPAGGFIGSFGVLTLNKGNIENLLIDGIYNPDGQLDVNNINVVPPKPLQYITPNWGTRDANWFFDFPTSAEKLMWFYEQTGGVETDGVIAITPKIIERLLELTGPIEMPDYGVTLDSENFLALVQEETQQNYDRELNRPKQILTDLTPILIEKLQDYDNKMELFNLLITSLEQKDIQVYSRDSTVQKFAKNQGWTGEILSHKGTSSDINDYLAVVFSNIGGWKTDIYTETEIDTVTNINAEGEIYRTVIISRNHEGGQTPYLWYNRPNHGYIKIYTPLGSEYVDSEGFSEEPPYIQTDYEAEGYVEDKLLSDIESTLIENPETGTEVFAETGRTVFGNWLWVPAGDRRVVSLTYKLPFNVEDADSYGLLIQKQSGIEPTYSGSVEEIKTDLRITGCETEERSLPGTSFNFQQTEDTQITCGLI